MATHTANGTTPILPELRVSHDPNDASTKRRAPCLQRRHDRDAA